MVQPLVGKSASGIYRRGMEELTDKEHTTSPCPSPLTELALEHPPISGNNILQTFTQPLQDSFRCQRTYFFQIVHVGDRQRPNNITSHYVMEFSTSPVNKPNTILPQVVGNLAKRGWVGSEIPERPSCVNLVCTYWSRRALNRPLSFLIASTVGKIPLLPRADPAFVDTSGVPAG